jgi:hypothetical protein
MPEHLLERGSCVAVIFELQRQDLFKLGFVDSSRAVFWDFVATADRKRAFFANAIRVVQTTPKRP